MKNIITSLSFVLLLIHTSCSNEAKGSADSSEPINEAVNSNADCLFDYMTKYDQLLPLEVIKKYYDVPSSAKMNYDFRPDAKTHDKDTYEYTWDSDRVRKMKFGGQVMDVPSPNRIGLRWVGSDLFMIQGKSTALENFRSFYKNSSAAEKEAAFKQAAKSLKEKGYDSKTVDAATNMGKELAADEIIFQNIESLGEAAVWIIKEKELTVLVGNITFQINVEVSENDEENINLAKKLAQEVLNKCK